MHLVEGTDDGEEQNTHHGIVLDKSKEKLGDFSPVCDSLFRIGPTLLDEFRFEMFEALWQKASACNFVPKFIYEKDDMRKQIYERDWNGP